MEIAQLIEGLRLEGARMTAAARAASADASVPTCPQWRTRDLIRHTGGVQRWASSYVAEARTEMRSEGFDEIVGHWPDDEELADWFEAGYLDLVAALEAAPPDLQCWTFFPAPSPLAMWSRRQAHETAIHRVDTELAAGRHAEHLSPFTPAFAADGVDELLTCFVPRRRTGLHTKVSHSLVVRCSDVDAAWRLRIDEEGVTTERLHENAPTHDEACTVSGPAADLYLVLWNRTDAGILSVDGDSEVFDSFRDAVRV